MVFIPTEIRISFKPISQTISNLEYENLSVTIPFFTHEETQLFGYEFFKEHLYYTQLHFSSFLSHIYKPLKRRRFVASISIR